jgi:hypothetical protein
MDKEHLDKINYLQRNTIKSVRSIYDKTQSKSILEILKDFIISLQRFRKNITKK